MHERIRHGLLRSTAALAVLATTVAALPSELVAQRCASCVEFFMCKGGASGGLTCDFLTGPCREDGSCPTITGQVPHGWRAPVVLVVDGTPGVFLSDGDRLLPVRCDSDEPVAAGVVLQVGNEQYIRLPGNLGLAPATGYVATSPTPLTATQHASK